MRDGNGCALGAVRRGRIRKLDMSVRVLHRQLTAAGLPDNVEPASVDTDDRPLLAVGHVLLGRVPPRGDPVTDADPLPGCCDDAVPCLAAGDAHLMSEVVDCARSNTEPGSFACRMSRLSAAVGESAPAKFSPQIVRKKFTSSHRRPPTPR